MSADQLGGVWPPSASDVHATKCVVLANQITLGDMTMTQRAVAVSVMLGSLAVAPAAFSCETQNPGCEGKVWFVNETQGPKCFTLFQGDSPGFKNFCLKPGERVDYKVRSGDTQCVIYEDHSPPGNCTRYPLRTDH